MKQMADPSERTALQPYILRKAKEDEDYIMAAEYGENDTDPKIAAFKRRN